jgi:hypothetical protein
MTVIAANYNGHCAACDELVEAGDAIGHSTDGWVGMRCCGIRA